MRKILTFLATLAAKMPAAIPDILIVSGVAVVSYGAWLLHPAAGFITGGLLMLMLGALAAKKAGK